MKKIFRKYFLPLKSTSNAFTPVIGSILLLLITLALAGIVVSTVFNLSGGEAGLQPQMSRITLESCKGGLYGASGPKAENISFDKNKIVLVHEGGSSLPLDSTSIRISGFGNSYRGIPGHGGTRVTGNISVSYLNLSIAGKNSSYETRNREVLKDGLWSAGEKLVLCGQDSPVSRIDSSVKVSVNGLGNTSDNYGFKAGSEINLRVIDSEGKTLIAELTAIVKLAN